MAQVEGERLGGVLITKLPPGGKIETHVDHGWHAEYYDKYFIPIINDQGCVFGFEGGGIYARAGDVYWFNNQSPHWVENHSERERIALIVCIKSHRPA
jgi:aspartyl/asparaginyl beta-hydroxylase (cupin superfamily)